jgi:cytochrome c553
VRHRIRRRCRGGQGLKWTKICSECHEKADWAGKDAAGLEAQIKDVVSGKTKHKKKITLTDKEIADVAAFWSSK